MYILPNETHLSLLILELHSFSCLS